jgi:hypothetical protein
VPSPAALTTITSATLAGGPRPNQDHLIVTDHAVAILDGASSFLPHDPTHDGGWYARTLGNALTPRLVDDQHGLVDIATDTIRDVATTHQLTPGDRWQSPETVEPPTESSRSATAAAARTDTPSNRSITH